MTNKYYTTDADGHGWLIVKYEENGATYPPLPQYTLIEGIEVRNGRFYFKILNGRSRGKIASLEENNATYHLNYAKGSYASAAKLRFNRRKGLLWYDINNPSEAISCKIYTGNPPPAGVYDLEIPDEVHSIASGYYSYSKYATTWFRIGHTGDRYLHPGNITAGCITVTALENWTSIYNYLIARRKDDVSVGTIHIFDS